MRLFSSAAGWLVICLSLPAAAIAADRDVAERGEIAACRAVKDAVERAGCYDLLFGGPSVQPTKTPATRPAAVNEASLARDAVKADRPTPEHSSMSIRWELDSATNRGLWLPRGHRSTYVLPARWTSDVNQSPQSPTQPASTSSEPLESVEAKFQLSLKLKAADDMFDSPLDLWVGYTQQSNWQVYNSELSRPFRETNYEPEIFATLPLGISLYGVTARMLNVGFVHQSNGRSDPLSRSWNRIFAQLGLEYGSYSLLVRPWIRLNEDREDDNNPDIESYVGRGDITGIWTKGEHTVSMMFRNSFKDDWRGAGQIDYSFPISGSLRGYLQVFSGYGESLIDYNHQQTTIGLGVLVIDVM
jgi:phospholipase A1/A2